MSAIGLDWSRSATETPISDSVKVERKVRREREFRAALIGAEVPADLLVYTADHWLEYVDWRACASDEK